MQEKHLSLRSSDVFNWQYARSINLKYDHYPRVQFFDYTIKIYACKMNQLNRATHGLEFRDQQLECKIFSFAFAIQHLQLKHLNINFC